MATSVVRPPLPTLDTPSSATFPSEIASPLIASPTVLRPVEPLKTPLTPPPAYLDFLAKKSPALSPPASATLFPKSIMAAEKPALTSTPSTESFASTKSSSSTASTVTEASSTDASVVETSSSVTSSETTEVKEISKESPKEIIEEIKKEVAPKDEVKLPAPAKSHARRISMPPPPSSPFGGPNSARSPRRLIIPGSPYSPRVQSPLSAGGLVSPYAIVSPRDRDPSEVVSVKQVVTRTMQLVRPPQTPIMEPVPASKKRKLEN